MEKAEADMSLLSDAMEECVMLDKVTANDGYGGTTSSWQEGAAFEAAITFDTSMEARTAQKMGVTNVYTVTTGRKMVLEYHDVFRRSSDGKIFRVTSDGDDKATPVSAGLNMRQVTAEEWILTS